MKMRTGILLVLVAVFVSTAGAQPRRFAVAIVRTDGRLVPFAAWNGGGWQRAWPEIFEAAGSPAAIDEVWLRRGQRVPRLWRVWPSSGGGPVRARVRGVEIVEAHCETQVALKTDFPEPRPRDPEEGVEGRFGIAVHDPAVPVRAIERLGRSHALWRKAEQVVRAGFDAREKAQALAGDRQLPRYEPTPRVLLSELYRQAGSPGSLVYFVAERAYPTGPFFADTTCPSRTVMSGWLAPGSGGSLTLLDPKVFVTDCDGKEIVTTSPLGALQVGKRSFWVVQEHGWEDETYTILEVGPAEVRRAFEVDGGGC
jgi:hypothetical protein